jgi:hypothetical protein
MPKRSAATASFSDKAKEAAARGRSIQAVIDRAEARRKKQKSETRCKPASGITRRNFRRSI